MWGFEILVMGVMIAINGVFAAFEIALASISISRLERLVEQKRRGAGAALRMKQGMERSLAVVQLGITMFGAVAAATGGSGATERISPWLRDTFGLSNSLSEVLGIMLVVVPLTVATIIFGELVPKVFALREKERVVLALSPPMRAFSLVVWPAVWFLDTCVKGVIWVGERVWFGRRGADAKSEQAELMELRESVALARTSLVFGAQEEKIILEAAQFAQRAIGEIMLPAEFISTLHADETLMNALVTAHMDMHTRFPATDVPDDPQTIIGYVNFKDIVAFMHFKPEEATLRAIVREIASYPDDTPISQCLEQMIRSRLHIALVRDADDRVAGMVTMEDLMEELVGEIEDEFDRLPLNLVPTGKGWIAGGGLPLVLLATRAGIKLPEEGFEEPPRTLSEWIEGRLDGPVVGGEVIEEEMARMTVRKTRRNRVWEVFVMPVGGGGKERGGVR